MAFISNVTFRPHCFKCNGPGARPHTTYGYVCPDCYYAIRLDNMLEDLQDFKDFPVQV